MTVCITRSVRAGAATCTRLDGDPRLGDEALGGAAKLARPEDLQLTGTSGELILIDVPLKFRRIGEWARA